MTTARVAFEPPRGWAKIDLDPPKIAESAGASITQWSAYAGPDDPALVAGCVATSIPGWVEDMRPAVEARTTSLLGAAASRITGAPTDVRAGQDGVFDVRAGSDVGSAAIGVGRTFIGFDETRVITCVIGCAPRHGDRRPLECDGVVASARLEGSREAPQPGFGLRGATWAVHHPRETAVAAGVLVLLAAVLAVGLRRRPRSTIH